MWDLTELLAEREAAGLYRRARALEPCGPVEAMVDGRRCLVFCSNDYLGLAQDERVREAFIAGARADGVGSGAAHLITGHRAEHVALEEELADFLGRERTLLFSTGYMANMGVIDALIGREDFACQDRLNHASLLDGVRLSGARAVRYQHADTADLERQLAGYGERRALVITDGVFSMDGDVAPLPEISRIARKHGAQVMVDDAHGIGVVGATGRGSEELFGMSAEQVPVLVGTFGKGLGTFGAFAAGSAELIEYLTQRARTFIYTTAPSPALAAATRASLRLVREEAWRRDHLSALVGRFRSGAAQLGLPLMDSATPIQPLLIGDAEAAMAVSRALEASGLLVTAIRPPTVPRGSARLRITLSAAHTEAHIDRLLDALEALRPLWQRAVSAD